MSQEFQDIYDRAVAKGRDAGNSCIPTPMTVIQRSNPLDDRSAVVYRETVDDGPCGFAWIIVKPGTSKFARWLKEKGYARPDSYYGGVSIWIKDYSQSMMRKEAHAMAMAKELQAAFPKMKINASSRMD